MTQKVLCEGPSFEWRSSELHVVQLGHRGISRTQDDTIVAGSLNGSKIALLDGQKQSCLWQLVIWTVETLWLNHIHHL